MARDYAKGKRKPTASKRKPARKSNAGQTQGGRWKVFFAGVITGVFVSFLAYLATLPPQPGSGPAGDDAQAASEPPPPKPRFDFYTLLPEQTISESTEAAKRDAPVERAAQPASPASQADMYVLQAGAFRQPEDAERRRAELIMLGLAPKVRETADDSGPLFRVFLGPFDSRSNMNRARSLTAGQGIETLALKRPAP